jgi:hypothetical protein
VIIPVFIKYKDLQNSQDKKIKNLNILWAIHVDQL